jgi:hypothetical protein
MAGFVNQTLPLRSLDLSLCGTFVTIAEKRSEVRPQIELMETIALCGTAEAGCAGEEPRRPDFDVT